MQDGEILALLGVFCQQEQWQQDLGVEGCVLDQGDQSIAFEPLAGEHAGVEGHFVTLLMMVATVKMRCGRLD